MFEMEFAVLLAMETPENFLWFVREFWRLDDFYKPYEKQITDLD